MPARGTAASIIVAIPLPTSTTVVRLIVSGPKLCITIALPLLCTEFCVRSCVSPRPTEWKMSSTLEAPKEPVRNRPPFESPMV